jgi:DNA helicase HerA-like ATPase
LTEKYRDSWTKENSKSITEAEQYLKHTFILIDEAQNYAPEETNDPHEKMLGELIHTIAAEGRKYGLHVILATQRPNKIKRGLLGECDNAIIMKMNSRSDLEHLAREMRILDVKLLEPCLHFQGQGNALAVGEMTRMAPYVQLFKSAPRRTREGGVDIPGF